MLVLLPNGYSQKRVELVFITRQQKAKFDEHDRHHWVKLSGPPELAEVSFLFFFCAYSLSSSLVGAACLAVELRREKIDHVRLTHPRDSLDSIGDVLSDAGAKDLSGRLLGCRGCFRCGHDLRGPNGGIDSFLFGGLFLVPFTFCLQLKRTTGSSEGPLVHYLCIDFFVGIDEDDGIFNSDVRLERRRRLQ